MKNRVYVVVGGSCTGKTARAFALADRVGSPVVVCGDQHQLVEGFPIATGASDALRYGNHYPHIHRLLYQSLPASTPATLTATQYLERLQAISVAYPTEPIVIEGLSIAYLSCVQRIDRSVVVVGCRPPRFLVAHLLARMVRGILAGVVNEVREGLNRYGRDCWHARNSLCVEYVGRYVTGEWSLVRLGIELLRAGLNGVPIQGKHRQLVASGMVRWI